MLPFALSRFGRSCKPTAKTFPASPHVRDQGALHFGHGVDGFRLKPEPRWASSNRLGVSDGCFSDSFSPLAFKKFLQNSKMIRGSSFLNLLPHRPLWAHSQQAKQSNIP